MCLGGVEHFVSLGWIPGMCARWVEWVNRLQVGLLVGWVKGEREDVERVYH